MQFSNLYPHQTLSRLASLGCFLFVCSLAGCGSSGPDDPATIQALKDLGVVVVPNGKGNINGLNMLPTDPAKLTEAINLSSELKALKTISISPGIPLSDDHMATIGKNGNLVELTIKEAPISDTGISKLTGCKKLESVSLIGTGVTSEALASLGRLPKLNMLNLTDTKVSGGFESLQSCSNLQWVLIGGLEISDEDAEAIAKIPALSHVTRNGNTKISDAAVQTLKSVKDCNVDIIGE